MSIAVYDIGALISGRDNRGKAIARVVDCCCCSLNKCLVVAVDQGEELKLLVVSVSNRDSRVLNIITLNADVGISSLFLSHCNNFTKAIICYKNGAICVVGDVLSNTQSIPSVINNAAVAVTKSVFVNTSNAVYSVYELASKYYVYLKQLQLDGVSTGDYKLYSFDADCGVVIPEIDGQADPQHTTKKPKTLKGKTNKSAEGIQSQFEAELIVHSNLNCLSVVLTNEICCYWHKFSLQLGQTMFSRNMNEGKLKPDSLLRCLSVPVCDIGSDSTVSFSEVVGEGDQVRVMLKTYDARYGAPSAAQTHLFPVASGNGLNSSLKILSIAKQSRSDSTIELLFSNSLTGPCVTRVVGKLCCVKAEPKDNVHMVGATATLSSLLGQLHTHPKTIGNDTNAKAAIDCVSLLTRSALNSLCSTVTADSKYDTVPYEAVSEFYNMFDTMYGGDKTRPVDEKDWDVVRLLVAPTCRPVRSRNGRVHVRQNYFSMVQHPTVWTTVLQEQKLDILLLICRYCVDMSELCAVETLAYCMGVDLSVDGGLWEYNTRSKKIEKAALGAITPKIKGKSKAKGSAVLSTDSNVSPNCVPIDDNLFLCAVVLETGFLHRPPQHVNSSGNINSNGCGFNGVLLSDAMKITFGSRSAAYNGGNTSACMLLFILSNLLKTCVVGRSNSRKFKMSCEREVQVVTRSCRDLYIKRIVEWTEAIMDSFLPVFAVLLLSANSDSGTEKSRTISATLKTTFATLLECINKVDICTSSLEATLGMWVHACRCGSSSDGNGEMSAELEDTKGSGVSSIGGSSSCLYQTETVFL